MPKPHCTTALALVLLLGPTARAQVPDQFEVPAGLDLPEEEACCAPCP